MSSVKKIAYLFHPTHIGLYILLASLVWSVFFYKAKLVDSRGTISVTGVAYEEVTSDLAEWDIKIEKMNPNRKESYDQLLADEKKVQSFLESKGIQEGISGSSYDTVSVYKKTGDYQTSNEVENYRSTAFFRVTSKDVHVISAVSGVLHAFAIDNNISITDSTVGYYVTELEPLKISLLEKALTNAKERATAIGKHSSSHIGRISNASQGIFQVNRANDSSVSDYGNYDTSSIGKSVRAVVTVEFEVE